MTKLNMILAGALAGVAAIPSMAEAQREVGRAQGFDIHLASTTTDLAETRIYEDGVARLKYDDQEQTTEMGDVAFSPDGRRAIYVHMTTAPINEGTAMQQSPPNNMQCALTALELSVDATGAFQVQRPASAPYDIFATNNDGNEYRNCNKPSVYWIDSEHVAVMFNYQPEGSGDTKRYVKGFRWSDLSPISINGQLGGQAVIMAKDNDDCDMHQSGNKPGVVYYKSGGITRWIQWAGCNGNGRDAGWANATELNCSGSPLNCNVTRLFDIELANDEERSRGRCSIGGPDQSFAVCSWTEGNTQPQRYGVWVAAIDLSEGGESGAEAQSRILWKERIERETYYTVNGEERDAYAMRMNQVRVTEMLPDGSIQPTSKVLLTWGRNRGGNNNDKKGGRSVAVVAMVIDTTRENYVEVMPKTNLNPLLLGLENTHVSVTDAVFGKGSNVMPGMGLLMGDHTGGVTTNAEMRTLMYDTVRNEMVNVGQHNMARSYDRHLYSNYLGNNPGNQGRNFAGCDLVRNPFADMSGNYVTYFQACALTGKAPQHIESAIKTSAFLSIFPVAFTADPPPVGGGWEEDELPGEDGGGPDDGGGDDGGGTSVGGCSTGSGGSTLLLGLALGLGLVIRRRK